MGRRWVAGLLLVGLLAACTGGDDRRDTTEGTATDGDGTSHGTSNPDVPVTVAGAPVTSGPHDAAPTAVGLRLSEGRTAAAPADPLALVDGTPLTPDEIDAVLARLPEWSAP